MSRARNCYCLIFTRFTVEASLAKIIHIFLLCDKELVAPHTFPDWSHQVLVGACEVGGEKQGTLSGPSG